MQGVDFVKATVFVTLAGSHAHGTSGPHSDIDLRGVCIAPLRERLSRYRGTFEHYEGFEKQGSLWDTVLPGLQAHATAQHSLGGKVEAVGYDVAKFLDLCARANPNALEILFADRRDWLYVREPWQQLHSERHRFLTKKVEATFLGYALGQLKKIRLHRGWLLNPPKAPPTRVEFGLPGASTLNREDRDRIERAIAGKLRGYGIDDLELPKPTRIQIADRMRQFMLDVLSCSEETLDEELRTIGMASLQLPATVAQALEAERRFRSAQKRWESYLAWKSERNPARAELERRFGYDTKHAGHLLRLLEMGIEIIQTGELRVRRDNATELIAVLNGALSFDDLVARAVELQAQMKEVMQRCTLPNDVDYFIVDDLLLRLIHPN